VADDPLHIIYESGRVVATGNTQRRGQRKWQLHERDRDPIDIERDQVGVMMTLSGRTNATRHRCSPTRRLSAVTYAEDEPYCSGTRIAETTS